MLEVPIDFAVLGDYLEKVIWTATISEEYTTKPSCERITSSFLEYILYSEYIESTLRFFLYLYVKTDAWMTLATTIVAHLHRVSHSLVVRTADRGPEWFHQVRELHVF